MAEVNFESGLPLHEFDLFDSDLLTTQFNSSAEGRYSVKIEKGLKTKDVMLSERQVAVGYENEIGQLEWKPSILALEALGESLSSGNETFQSLGNLQDESVQQFELNELEAMVACNRFEKIDIYPLPSEKEKNPPYLINGKDITTKNEIPVSLMIEGCKPRDKVRISMRYCDELTKDLPVKRCKLHPNGDVGKLPSELHPNFNFYLTTNKCSYRNSTEDALKHPTAEIDLQDTLIDGKFKFSIVFHCLNSCHRRNSKKLELIVEVYNCDGILEKKECIDVRVCKNVKRDHKEKNQSSSPKRKISSSDDESRTPQKMKMIRAKMPQDTHPSDNSGSTQEREQSYMIQMKSKEDTTTILNLIKRLGGEYHAQAVCEIIPVEIIDEPDTFVNVSVPIESNVLPDTFVDLIEECKLADIKFDGIK